MMAAEDGSAAPTPTGVADPSATPQPTPDVPDLGKAPGEPSEPTQEEKAEAAVKENGKVTRTATYRVGSKEVTVKLPPKLPASFKFRVSALDDNDPAVLRVVRKLIGDEPWEEIMDAMDEGDLFDEDGDSNLEAETGLANFVNDILASYGVTTGESQASQKS